MKIFRVLSVLVLLVFVILPVVSFVDASPSMTVGYWNYFDVYLSSVRPTAGGCDGATVAASLPNLIDHDTSTFDSVSTSGCDYIWNKVLFTGGVSFTGGSIEVKTGGNSNPLSIIACQNLACTTLSANVISNSNSCGNPCVASGAVTGTIYGVLVDQHKTGGNPNDNLYFARYCQSIYTSCIDVTPTPTPSSTLTPTLTSTPVPTFAFTPGCVDATSTSIASPSVAPFFFTPSAVASVTGTPPAPTATTPFTLPDLPPGFGVSGVETFDSGLGTWSVDGSVQWSSSVGHNGAGSALMGGGSNPVLALDGTYSVGDVVHGWAYFASTSGSVSVTVGAVTRLDGGSGWSIPDTTVNFTRSRDGDTWRQFTVVLNASGRAIGLQTLANGFGDPPELFYFDDLQYASAGSLLPGVDICGGGSVGGYPTPSPLDFNTSDRSGGGVDLDVTVEDDPATNPCIGWYGFSLSYLGFAGATVPGIRVCFARYTINRLAFGDYDAGPAILAVTLGLSALSIIDAIRTTRK